jgi:HEPN domain-containing protein
VRKAEEDYQVAVRTHRSADGFHNTVCFHCQQAAEKFLKALMAENTLSIPKTHDLEDLRTLILPHCSALRPLRRGLVFLSRFAVETRYPGDDASKRQAKAALRWADGVRSLVRAELGIRSRRSRRRK